MSNTEIYAMVCMLHWKTDLSIPQIAIELQKHGVTSYTHRSELIYVYHDLTEAVNRIIQSEKNSWLKAAQFKIKETKNHEKQHRTAIFRTAE